MWEILLMSTLAGVIGTGLGGVVGLIFGNKGQDTVSYLLSFAAGVMLSIAFFDLIPEALSVTNIYIVALSIIGGVACIWGLNFLIDTVTNSRRVHVRQSELRHQDELFEARDKRSMLRSGLLMFFAIALHNFPEGLAIGAGGSHQRTLGLMLALLIALHNIPEGISIAVPLIEGGMNKGKAVLLTALSGAPTLLGGLAGMLLGGAGDVFVGISLALAGGAMIYITFCEILPQALLLNHTRKPAIASLAGVLFGLIMVQALS